MSARYKKSEIVRLKLNGGKTILATVLAASEDYRVKWRVVHDMYLADYEEGIIYKYKLKSLDAKFKISGWWEESRLEKREKPSEVANDILDWLSNGKYNRKSDREVLQAKRELQLVRNLGKKRKRLDGKGNIYKNPLKYTSKK